MLINTIRAAKELGITPRRITALIKSGRLPAEKLGRDWLIKMEDLERVRVRKPGRPKNQD